MASSLFARLLAQNLSLLQTTNKPSSLNIWCSQELVFFRSKMSCRHILADIAWLICPVATYRFVIFMMAYICSFRSPVLDALIRFLHVSIYSIYCNHNLAARDFSCNAIFVDSKIALRACISGMSRSTAASLLKTVLYNFWMTSKLKLFVLSAFSDNAICWSFINSALSVRMHAAC